MVQDSTTPPVVKLEAIASDGRLPEIERFADARGIIVRMFVSEQATAAVADPLTASARLSLASAISTAPLRFTAGPTFAPLVAPADRLAIWRTPTRAVPATIGLAATNLQTSAEAREPEYFASLTRGMSSRPAPLAGDALAVAMPGGATVDRIRVVAMNPLRVAIDCSEPIAYQVGRLATPPGFAVTFPTASLGTTCERTVSLHPELQAAVETMDTGDGAMVIIPALDGMRCDASEGSSSGTVVCEIVADNEMVAQIPAALVTPVSSALRVGDPLINLDFQNAPIVEILTALAQYAEKNIITTSAVTGVMSYTADGITLIDALNIVTKLNGLDYTLVGEKNYVVGTTSEIEAVTGSGSDGMPLTYTYKPERTTPERIAVALRSVIEPLGVTIEIREDTEEVLFTGIPDQRTAAYIADEANHVDVPPVDVSRPMVLDYLSLARSQRSWLT